MTTVNEDEAFLTEVVGLNLLEVAVGWIGNNLEPYEVFDERTLIAWAEDNGYTKE